MSNKKNRFLNPPLINDQILISKRRRKSGKSEDNKGMWFKGITLTFDHKELEEPSIRIVFEAL